MSEEQKRKQSEKMKGRYRGEKNPMYGTIGKLSPNFGRKLSRETKMKISESHKGSKCPWTSEFNRTRKGEKSPMYGKKGPLNHNFGRKLSEEEILRIKERNKGEGNPMYNHLKEDVGYTGIHRWVKTRLPKTELCQLCNIIPPYDLANVSGNYLRDLDDWLWLCRRCHMDSDGRLMNFIKPRIKH